MAMYFDSSPPSFSSIADNFLYLNYRFLNLFQKKESCWQNVIVEGEENATVFNSSEFVVETKQIACNMFPNVHKEGTRKKKAYCSINPRHSVKKFQDPISFNDSPGTAITIQNDTGIVLRDKCTPYACKKKKEKKIATTDETETFYQTTHTR